MSSASGVKSWTLGFVTGAGCKASWRQSAEIAKIRGGGGGGDVIVSFGGAAAGIELAQACTSVSTLAAEYQAVVKAYSLK